MFGKIVKSIKNFQNREAREKEAEKLRRFREKLNQLGKMPNEPINCYYYSLEFFRAVTELQNEANGHIQFHGDVLHDGFDEIFHNVGRTSFGINRTKQDCEVTFHSIYLGGIFGLNTNDAKHWIKNHTVYVDFAKRWGVPGYQEVDPTMMEVICWGQLVPIVKDNLKVAIELTEEFKK